MNMKTITSALIAVAMGLSLGAPSTALAGDRNHDRQGYGQHAYKQDRHYKKQRRHTKRHKKQYAKRHFKGHDWHNYNRRHYSHGGYDNRYYGYDDDDDSEKLLIGLVVGGILGYALNANQYDNGDY
jgi:hypothetical protein